MVPGGGSQALGTLILDGGTASLSPANMRCSNPLSPTVLRDGVFDILQVLLVSSKLAVGYQGVLKP